MHSGRDPGPRVFVWGEWGFRSDLEKTNDPTKNEYMSTQARGFFINDT